LRRSVLLVRLVMEAEGVFEMLWFFWTIMWVVA
jgi:hypothetical protein